MEEIWKLCPGYVGVEVSSLGQVRISSSGKILKPFENMDKYLQVDLHNYATTGTKLPTVHKLVAITFLPPHPDDGMRYLVDHRDMDTKNNRISNLEWITWSENSKRWRELKGKEYRKRCRIHVPELDKTFSSIKECSDVLGIRLESIRAVSKWGNNGGTIRGLHFERVYEDEKENKDEQR